MSGGGLRRDQRRLGAFALEHRVRRDGRAVDDLVRGEARLIEASEYPS